MKTLQSGDTAFGWGHHPLMLQQSTRKIALELLGVLEPIEDGLEYTQLIFFVAFEHQF